MTPMEVEVVRAYPRRFESCRVLLAPDATVADALRACPWPADEAFVSVAVFGRRVGLDATLQHGDRVELLRPLVADPKDARRRRAEQAGRG